MTVRAARAADVDGVLALIQDIPGLPRWSRESLAAVEPSRGSAGVIVRRLLVAESCGKLDGFAQIYVVMGEAELESIAVRPERRSRGLGNLLLRSAMEAAKQDGAEVFRLEVRSGNSVAHQLYRSAGMSVVGRRRAYYSDPVEDAVLMEIRWSDGALESSSVPHPVL